MSLYSRNEIVKITIDDKKNIVKEGIYASFPYEIDGEYDYLLLDEIHKVKMSPESNFLVFKNSVNRSEEVNIYYKIECNETKDKIELTPIYNETLGSLEEIEIQDFADSLIHSVYQNTKMDQTETIKQAKINAINKLKQDLLKLNGSFCPATQYNVVGRIIDVNNNIVGIINSFIVEDKNELHITLNDVVSYVPLKELDILKIEFPTGNYSLTIMGYEITKSLEGIIKQYTLKITRYETSFTNEEIICETENGILDKDIFFDSRSTLLSSKEEVFNIENNDNNIKGLFDGFDFDF